MKLGTTSWLTGGNFLDNARLVVGQADFVELLVYTWDREMRAKVAGWLDGLADLQLEYTVHLPTDTASGAYAAAAFFVDSGFPLLNMTLHPLPGWRQFDWPPSVALENMIDRVEDHRRMTYDLTHSLLGVPFPAHLHSRIVELHLSGTDGSIDHLPLNDEILQQAFPILTPGMLVCCEIFDVEAACTGLDLLRTLRSLTLGPTTAGEPFAP
jgi:hypothetical protein